MNDADRESLETRVLVLASTDEDTERTCAILAQAEIACAGCADQRAPLPRPRCALEQLRSVGIPLGLEPSATFVVKCGLRLFSAFALTGCATYSLHDAGQKGHHISVPSVVRAGSVAAPEP